MGIRVPTRHGHQCRPAACFCFFLEPPACTYFLKSGRGSAKTQKLRAREKRAKTCAFDWQRQDALCGVRALAERFRAHTTKPNGC